jgi:glycosyltransferase involved in cell wall biosynthesis
MKHVWILNHYAQEPGGSGGTRHYSLARHLLTHGWSSTIIAASVELNTGRQRLAAGENMRTENFNGVNFLWVKTPQYEGNGVDRIYNILIYSFQVLRPSVTKGLPRPDVIIGSSVHPFAALSGAILARFFCVPFIFEVRDLWPQTLIDMGSLTPNGLKTNLLRRLERWLYRKANRIVVLLPKACEYIVPLGIQPDKIVWIPNGVDLEFYPEPPQVKNKDDLTLMYFGAHGQANGLDCVLKAMSLLKKIPGMARVRLRLIGDGPLKKDLQQLAITLGLDNVQFEDPIPKKKIPTLATDADIFVFNLIDAPVFRFGISSNKLFDFMAGARPIIFCCESSNNPVEEAKAGITSPPGDPVELSKAIVALAEMTCEQRAMMGNAGRNYVKRNHSFENLAKKLAATLDELVP